MEWLFFMPKQPFN